jgi:hypothetical protein
MEKTDDEKRLKEMVEKTKGMKCAKHNCGVSIALVGYPGEVRVSACCKEFGSRIEEVCDVILVNFKVFLS